MDVLAVVVAGDRAHDFASLVGVSVIVRSVRVLLSAGVVDHVTLLVSREHREGAVRACAELPVTVGDLAGSLARVGAHGRERADATAGDGPTGIVLVHEAVRPLAPPALAAAVVDAVRAGHPAAVPVLPVVDTVKLVDARGVARAAANRSALRVVQSPVAFRADLLHDLLAENALDVVRACAAAGEPAHTVPGDPMAFPLRTAWDLELAETLVSRSP